MASPKTYIHDRLVLLLVTVNIFLALLGSVLILLKFNPGRNEGYIVQYRANLGISAFKVGHASDLLAFIGFLIVVTVFSIILSVRMYEANRYVAVTALAFGTLLLVLGLIVSNALLVLP